MRTAEPKKFIEVRFHVSEKDGRPSDLALATGSLILMPPSGPPLKKDLQLMMPESGVAMPETEPRALPDGRALRVQVVDIGGGFVTALTGGATSPPYFKIDVPAELTEKGARATVLLRFPSGQHRVELGTLSGK